MSTGIPIVVLKKGMLTKCSKYLKNWHERYVVLTNERLLTYEKEDPNADCTLDLFLREIQNFKVNDEDEVFEFSFECEGKNYIFKAENKNVINSWGDAIEKALETIRNRRTQGESIVSEC